MRVNVRPLGDFLETLAELDPDGTIYITDVSGVRADTPAILGAEAEPAPNGFRYLLEVSIAQEVLEVWSEWREGRTPSLVEKVEAVVHYARRDAYLPVTG
jgi:hypothetical protein